MDRGYTKSWRKELDSDIWLMPPLYLKVWYYLRHKVQWKPYLFPTNSKFGIWVLPGQRITSIRQIAEDVKWSEWGVETIPNKKTIAKILEWFKTKEMIAIESNDKGTLITIINWDIYNINDDEKVTQRGHGLDNGLDTRKERIELKEGKEESKVKRFVPPSVEEVQEYMKKINFDGDAQKWVDFYTGKGWMVGKNKMVDWRAAVRTWKGNGVKQPGGISDDFKKRFLGSD